jgi:hypothetical protein
MKFSVGRALLSFAVFIDPASARSSSLIGEWQQVYSDYFVQSTNEVDWHCVNVSVEASPGQPGLVFTKSTFLHGGDVVYKSPQETLIDEAGIVILGAHPFIDRYGDSKENITVLTGLDNLSLFVWARNATSFIGSDEEKDILKDLAGWDFSGTYKSPLVVPCVMQKHKEE